jgi:NAD(P)-dependent dehydrogenase (short-subunit alcohol dehydrogenase family)
MGIGYAIAHRLAELGAHVALHDLSWDAPAKYNGAANLGEVAEATLGGRTATTLGNIGAWMAAIRCSRDEEARTTLVARNGRDRNQAIAVVYGLARTRCRSVRASSA